MPCTCSLTSSTQALNTHVCQDGTMTVNEAGVPKLLEREPSRPQVCDKHARDKMLGAGGCLLYWSWEVPVMDDGPETGEDGGGTLWGHPLGQR